MTVNVSGGRTPGMSRCRKLKRSVSCRQSAPCPCSAYACVGSSLSLPSDVAHLIVHFLCGHSVENTQETPCNFPGWATDRNDDALMGLTCRNIGLRKRLEV